MDVGADPIGIARTVIRFVTNDVGDVKGETKLGAAVIETGKSAFVFFYLVVSWFQYEDSMALILHMNSFANLMY